MCSDTVNTNCCLNPSLAWLVDSVHYKKQTTSLQITIVHQKVCFFPPSFSFCQSNSAKDHKSKYQYIEIPKLLCV